VRLLVTGSRNWSDVASVEREIVRAGAPLTVIHGDASGADRLAADFATSIMHEVIPFPANWSADGRAAGPIRNARMLRDGRPDRGLAFGALWKRHTTIVDGMGAIPGWKTTGTGGMVSLMLRAGLPVRWVAAPDAPAVDLTKMPGPPGREGGGGT